MLGSGKSTLIAIMAERGMRIVKSDDLARELMESNSELRAKLVEILGEEAYSASTLRLDRDYIASRIFKDNSLRREVEAAVHPVVTSEIENIFRENNVGRPVAVESALILQSKFQERFDYIVLVEAPKQASIERAIAGNRMTEQDAIARFEEQSRDRPDTDEADFIVENSGSKEEFEKRCTALIDLLEAIGSRDLPDEPLHSLPE
jgi:dephospho-CoA kinase